MRPKVSRTFSGLPFIPSAKAYTRAIQRCHRSLVGLGMKSAAGIAVRNKAPRTPSNNSIKTLESMTTKKLKAPAEGFFPSKVWYKPYLNTVCVTFFLYILRPLPSNALQCTKTQQMPLILGKCYWDQCRAGDGHRLPFSGYHRAGDKGLDGGGQRDNSDRVQLPK